MSGGGVPPGVVTPAFGMKGKGSKPSKRIGRVRVSATEVDRGRAKLVSHYISACPLLTRSDNLDLFEQCKCSKP